jgi:hypothetical protein
MGKEVFLVDGVYEIVLKKKRSQKGDFIGNFDTSLFPPQFSLIHTYELFAGFGKAKTYMTIEELSVPHEGFLRPYDGSDTLIGYRVI